jgi:hypothetical protein
MMTVDPTPAFQAYGRAMATIGGLEQIMRLALGEHEVRRAQRAGEADPERLRRFTTRLLKLDFGGLSQRVCDNFQLPSGMRDTLKEAKTFRNYFAHDFWAPNYGNLRSQRGIEIVVRHCRTLERQIGLVATLIVRATRVNVATYIDFIESQAGDEEVFHGWETRLAAAEAALDGDEMRLRNGPIEMTIGRAK